MESFFQFEESESNGRFFRNDESGNMIAEIKYTKENTTRIQVTHTWVDSEHRGDGLAGKLVNQIVSYARNNKLKIVPVCPYVKKKLRSKDQYSDILA